jgi:hypothetical protein
MIIVIGLIFLQISFTSHMYFLIQYVLKKDGKYLRRFVNTAISNILIAGVLTVLSLFRPDLLRDLNLGMLFWLMSGLMMMTMLLVKVNILRNIYRRSHDPENYHFNFFGKKVLHSSVVSKGEVYIFLFTIPFFLFSGAYFFARLVNLIMFKRL